MMTFDDLIQNGFIPTTLHRIATNNRTVPYSNAIHLAPSKLDVVGVICDKPKWVAITTNSVEEANEVYSANEKFVFIYKKEKHEFFKLSVTRQGLATLEISSVGEPVSTGTSKISKMAKTKTPKFKEDTIMSNGVFDNAFGAIPTAPAGAMGAFNASPAAPTPAAGAATSVGLKTAGRINREFKAHCFHLSSINHFITGTEAVVGPRKVTYPKLGPDQQPLVKQDEESVKAAKEAKEAGKKVPRKHLQMNTTIGFVERKPSGIKAVCFTRPAIFESDPKIMNAIMSNEKVEFDASNQDVVTKVESAAAFNTYVGLCCHGSMIKENAKIYGPEARTFVLSVVDYKKKNKDGGTTDARKSKLSVFKPDKTKKVNTSILQDSNYVPMKLYVKAGQQNLTAEQIEMLNNSLYTVVKDQANYDLLDDAAKAAIKFDANNATNPVTSEYFKEGKCQTITAKRFFDKEKDLDTVKFALKKRHVGKENKISYKFLQNNFDDETAGIKADEKYKAIVAASGYTDIDAYIADVKAATKKASSSTGSKNTGITGEAIAELLLANQAVEGFMAAGTLQDLMNPIM